LAFRAESPLPFPCPLQALEEIVGEHKSIKLLSLGAAGKGLKLGTWIDELVMAQDNTPPGKHTE
jgi:hypothetical protein